MVRWVLIFGFLFSWSVVTGQDIPNSYFTQLAKLEFEEARQVAKEVPDTLLRKELFQLADVLFYEGQTDVTTFSVFAEPKRETPVQAIVRALKTGYVSLFYDRVKGDAYRHFYSAYQIARAQNNSPLTKACLLALLKYHNFEIAQNSDSYLPYLTHYEELATDTTDRVWVTVYKMIFYSKAFQRLEAEYFNLSTELDRLEATLDGDSPLLTYIFYEKALMLELKRSTPVARVYYERAFRQAKDFPFLRYHRFFASLKQMMIDVNRNRFDSARHYLDRAKKEINLADTIRSNYHINLYSAFLLKSEGKYDSAFSRLWEAYRLEFQLDFRRNTLEINRLSVELETQEKELANLQLRQSRTWLVAAVAGLTLLAIAGYLFYTNRLSRNKILLKEKEVESMRLEKMLKDQEISGIDAMIEGQEKERKVIAADLHDNLGSTLATVKFHIEALRGKIHAPASEKEALLEKTDSLLEEAYQKIRTIAHARNAGVNAKDGLLRAVKSFASKISVLNRLTIEVEEHGMDNRLDNAVEIMLFRIIQELTTNIIKHARATEVTIHLTRHDEVINLMVEDDGKGFDLAQIKPGETMGLYSIQKKIENLGGRVTIDSIIGKGTTVIVDIPLTT